MGHIIANLVFRAADRFRRACDDFRVERTKRSLGACGERVFLSPLCSLWSEHLLRLGDDVHIHAFTHIFAGGGVTIGNGTMISAGCLISSVTHPKKSTERHRHDLVYADADDPPLCQPVVLGRNVWLGMGAIILPGVTIGDHAIVGAGAVVTKDVPEKTVVVGNPARVVQTLTL